VKTYDIVIVGAGMVGATLACTLGESHLNVALIEGQPPAAFDPQGEYDLRVSAITLASRAIFENLGAWPTMVARRVSPLRGMRVWDADGDARIAFDSAELGEAELGYIIENRVVAAGLWDRLRDLGTVELVCPASIAALALRDDGADVTLTDGQRLRTRLVVGADGARSQVRSLAGIATRGWGYQQDAIVTTVHTEQAHQEIAWQRFLPTGPLAFLPLNEPHLCSIVWSCARPRGSELMALDDVTFLQELQTAFGDDLGRLEAIGARAAFALSLSHAEHYVLPRLALIGDAAHTVHPLAGQGVNLGLGDAAVLAEVIDEARRTQRDIGALPTLRRFERWRKGDNLAMLGVTDAFQHLFGANRAALAPIRNAGMGLFNRLTPAKRWVMLRAMGLSGDLPALARRTHQ
jgi:2-octaprenylphenol hydroxylase